MSRDELWQKQLAAGGAPSRVSDLLKIAYVSQLDPENVGCWSGTPYFLVAGLRRRNAALKVVGALRTPFGSFVRGMARVRNRLCRTKYDASRNRYVAMSLASEARERLGGEAFDFVLCTSSILGAYLPTDCPLVTWEDSTFAGMQDYYPGTYSAFSHASVAASHFLQQRSLDHATLSVFSSDWAAQSAIARYGADPAKIRVIPFGANLETPPTGEIVESALQARLCSPECRLLFIGVEWERKGGDTVLQAAGILHQAGVKVVVDIVGVRPPYPVPDYVRVHGYISKTSASGRAFLDSLFLAAHFLFVPSIAECYGLVYAEASAFGVPSLSRLTGGIPSVVINGENGWLLPLDSPADAFASLIRSGLANADAYTAISRRARTLYEERFNWDAAIATLEREVNSVLR